MNHKCVFCKIVSKSLPAYIVYEDASTLAFLDIAPAAKGHVLLISKTHTEGIFDASNKFLEEMIKTAAFLARGFQKVLNYEGLNLIQNNGQAAGQTVFHIHMHLIPRWKDDDALRLWKPNTFPVDKDGLEKLHAQLLQFCGEQTIE